MAKAKGCAACGRAYRKGTRAFVVGRGGSVVCPECAGAGLLVVAPRVAPVHVERVERSPDVDVVLRRLRGYAAMTRASAAKAQDTERAFGEGRATGLETAIELLVRLQKDLA